ncbi:general substrate transporter [Cladochytrium replicatum]|nr:general substrate transporter [Cladochytrium replicatum]
MPENKTTVYMWLVAFAAGVGGLCFGYEIGVIGQVLPMNDFGAFFGYLDATKVDKDGNFAKIDAVYADRTAWITSTFTIGCFLGALVSSYIADKFSRRYSILAGGILFTLGGLLQAFSVNYAMIIVGRIISGISIGFASMSVPLYISESAPTYIRGTLITVYQLMITIGIFIATCVNTGIILALKNTQTEWRLALGVQTIPGILLTILMFFMPFSPRWLMYKHRDAEALNVLSKIRGEDVNSAEVQAEYNHIKESIAAEEAIGEASWSELFQKGIFNRVLMGFLLQFFQQWTGINVILYYGAIIFSGVGFTPDQTAISLPIANAAVNIIGTFPGMYLIERMGRKKLMVYGGIGMAISHFMVCLFFGLNKANPGSLGWGAIIFVYFFILFFSSTWGPVVWVYQSEIFPLRVRAKGTAVATMSNWGWNAVVGNTAPRLFEPAALDFYTYLIYGGACIVMSLYVLFVVPETKGRSLEDMDEIFGTPGTGEKPSRAADAEAAVEVGKK